MISVRPVFSSGVMHRLHTLFSMAVGHDLMSKYCYLLLLLSFYLFFFLSLQETCKSSGAPDKLLCQLLLNLLSSPSFKQLTTSFFLRFECTSVRISAAQTKVLIYRMRLETLDCVSSTCMFNRWVLSVKRHFYQLFFSWPLFRIVKSQYLLHSRLLFSLNPPQNQR